MNGRMKILLGMMAGLLALAALWSYQQMEARKLSAQQAQADLVDCRSLAGKIRQSRAVPCLATSKEPAASESIAQIEQAVRSAGIAPNSLDRITPEMPRRVGDTAYKEKPTQVQLRKVSLRQVAALAYNLRIADVALNTGSVRLSAPRDDDTTDLWNAELVLTYLIYDPPRAEGTTAR